MSQSSFLAIVIPLSFLWFIWNLKYTIYNHNLNKSQQFQVIGPWGISFRYRKKKYVKFFCNDGIESGQYVSRRVFWIIRKNEGFFIRGAEAKIEALKEKYDRPVKNHENNDLIGGLSLDESKLGQLSLYQKNNKNSL